ncbi:UNVERIFIED_CONTAM: hypothetical protein K2H54_024027 [Gekko kuhli]
MPGGRDAVGPHNLLCYKKSCMERYIVCTWKAGNAPKANYTLHLRYQDSTKNKTFQAGENTFFSFDENDVSSLSNVTIWVENHAEDSVLVSEKVTLQISEAVKFDAPNREKIGSSKANGTLTLKWPKPSRDCPPIKKEARMRRNNTDEKWTLGNCEDDDDGTRKLVGCCCCYGGIGKLQGKRSTFSRRNRRALIFPEIHESPKVTYTVGQLGSDGLRNVMLEWEKPSQEQGEVNYTLTFVLLPCNCTKEVKHFSDSYHISLSGAGYYISLQASNRAGRPPPFVFHLLPAEQDPGLPFLRSHLSGKHLSIEWAVKTEIEDYCFEEQPLGEALQGKPCTEEAPDTDTVCSSGMLEPNRCYRLAVHALDAETHVWSTFAFTHLFSRNKPIQVRVTNRTTDSAILWWEPPKALSACPSTLKKYIVCCREEQAGNVTYYEANALETHYTVLGLHPNTTYQVGVWASTGEEDGACQPLKSFRTHPPVTLALSFWYLGIFGGLLSATGIFCFGKKRAKEAFCSALPDPANTEAVKVTSITEAAQVRLKQGFKEPLEFSSPTEPFLVELPPEGEPSANAKVDSPGVARQVEEFLLPKEDPVGSATLLPLEYNSQGLLNPVDDDDQGQEGWGDFTGATKLKGLTLAWPRKDGSFHSLSGSQDHAVKEPLCPEISAPLHGQSFLQASHFQLGFDRSPEGSTVVSPYRFDYPPRWGTYLREPILPPKCAGVLNQDMGDPWETKSEYLVSYPAWPLATRPAICPLASCIQMHTDPRHHVFTSTTREIYTYPSKALSTQPHRVDKWDDSIPRGDKEKVPLPPSLYQQSYPAHKGLSSAVRAPNQHLGSDSTLKGDGGVHFDSSYRSQYTGEWGPPPKRCHEGLISVVFGDPRCHNAVSEQRHAYPAPHPADLCCYTAEQAARQLFRTNFQAGRASVSYPHRNMSSILRGDESAQRNKGNVTTSSFYYGEPGTRDLKPRQPSSLKEQRTLQLGDRHLGSFSTTQQSDYRQLPKTPIVYPKSSDLMKSSIAFNFPDTGTSTTTQDMLVPHQLRKHQVPEELIQKIKHSHLVQPWQGQRWFSTEQREAYVNKYSGPVLLAVGDCQRSSVPLGTMKTFQHRSKWLPGIQAQEIPAQKQ